MKEKKNISKYPPDRKGFRIFFQEDKPQNSTKGLYELIKWAKEQTNDNIKTFIEIGCFAGISTEIFAKHFNKIWAIDIWEKSNCGIPIDLLIEAKKRFKKRIEKYNNIEVREEKSIIVANEFEDQSIDMIYIDGSHLYDDIKNDIKTWRKKVRKGGILCGHDYHNIFAVRKAVQEEIGKVITFSDYSWATVI